MSVEVLIAAEFVTPDVIAAAVACVSFASKAVAHVDAAVVVNCAAAAVLDPEVQLVITLQSYNEEAIKPVKFALVAVCAVEKLVQVDDEFNL